MSKKTLPSPFSFFLGLLGSAVLLGLLAPTPASADLVWDAERGWRIEGGILDRDNGEDRDTAAPTTALQLMNKGKELQEQGRQRAALRRYRQVIRRYDQSIFVPQALFQRGIIFQERKQWNKAMSAFNTIAREHPGFADFDELIRRQFEIAEALQQGARLRLAGTLPGFRSKSSAVEFYEDVIRNGPFTPYAPRALVNIAELELSRNNPEEAIDAFDRLIHEYPRSALAPESYLGLAEAFAMLVSGPEYDQSPTRQAISFYEDFLILFPDHEGVARAEEGLREMQEILARSKLVLAEFYHFRRRNETSARIFYNETITVSPQSEAAATARRRLAEMEESS